jgi:hypothetical protein
MWKAPPGQNRWDVMGKALPLQHRQDVIWKAPRR